MMHDFVLPCHIDVPSERHVDPIVSIDTPSTTRVFERVIEYGGRRRVTGGTWVPAHEQTVAGTASRHSSPRRWRRALERSVAVGHLPGATSTTLTIATDLAERMDYATGHVRYRIAETITRTRLGRSTVTKHVALLRAAGWLAWAEHGSLRNSRRDKGLPGYAATAAVYAATIPQSFDAFAGNRLSGTGYAARVVGATETGREQQVQEAVDNSQKRPVDNPADNASWTPSLRVVDEECQVQVEGGLKNTSRKRAADKSKSTGITRKRTGRSPLQVAHDVLVARQVRPRVQWTQTEGLRRLAFSLRPLIDRGLDVEAIVAELHGLGITWRPARPAALIRHHLAMEAAHQELLDQVVRPEDNAAWAGTDQAGTDTPEERSEFELWEHELLEQQVFDEAPLDADGFPDVDQMPADVLLKLRWEGTVDAGMVRATIAAMSEAYARRLFGDFVVDNAKRTLMLSGRIEIGTTLTLPQ